MHTALMSSLYRRTQTDRNEGGKSLICSCLHAHEKVRLDVSSRIRFSLLIFLSFILRFWNQIFTCLSVRLTLLLISRRRSRVRYMLNKNSFSNSKVWCFVYGHLFFLPLFAVNQLLVGVSFLDSAKKKDNSISQKQTGKIGHALSVHENKKHSICLLKRLS